jgi:co-chaperonin GroES (HSP10)
MALVAATGYVLVELKSKNTYAVTPDKMYDNKTEGIIREFDNVFGKVKSKLCDKRVWFDAYNDIRIEQDGKEYTFIKIEDIRGFDNDEDI